MARKMEPLQELGFINQFLAQALPRLPILLSICQFASSQWLRNVEIAMYRAYPGTHLTSVRNFDYRILDAVHSAEF